MNFGKTLNYHAAAPLSCGTHHKEDPRWKEDLSSAVEQSDEMKIWEIMQWQIHNPQAADALAELVGRLEYESSNTRIFSEIFLLPIIQNAGENIVHNKPVWKASSEAIGAAVRQWFPNDHVTTLFPTAPNDWIANWTPNVTRWFLFTMKLGGKSDPVSFPAWEIELPESAPKLGFMVIVCSRQRGWPITPNLDSSSDSRLKTIVRCALQMAEGSPGCQPIVLSPQRIAPAVTDGIIQWLVQLHEVTAITGFVVGHSTEPTDVVQITLRLDSEDVPLTRFNLRMHQIGMTGLHEILAVLQSVAPNLELLDDAALCEDFAAN